LSAKEKIGVMSVGEGKPKPEGGFCLISVGALLQSWQAYRDGSIQYQDLRVWFAAHELAARRCTLRKGRTPAYRVDELAGLLRGGRKPFRGSLSRLEASGLMSWGSSAITFPKPESSTRLEKRLVPVPRRALRFLAGCTKPVLAATVLAHLVRCLFYRDGDRPRGPVASWVAEVFGVTSGASRPQEIPEQIGYT
jgi:hypothetical protein